jgi:hypothetical protein
VIVRFTFFLCERFMGIAILAWRPNSFALMRTPRLAAIGLIALTASAHAIEQNALNPDASADNALAITAPAETAAIGPIDTAPIEAPPLPRPRPSLRDTVADGAAALISAFRQQHGEGSVAVNGALTRIAQEQANAMAGVTYSTTMYWLRFQTGRAVAPSIARLRISHMVMLILLAP